MLCTAVCIEYDINNVISIDDRVAIRRCCVSVKRTLGVPVLLIPVLPYACWGKRWVLTPCGIVVTVLVREVAEIVEFSSCKGIRCYSYILLGVFWIVCVIGPYPHCKQL